MLQPGVASVGAALENAAAADFLPLAVMETDDAESSLSWLWSEFNKSQDRGFVFWTSQAIALLGLAGFVWGASAVWDRWLDGRASRVIDAYLNAVEFVARPADRAMRAQLRRLDALLPERLRSSEVQWELLLCLLSAVTIFLLAVQHASNGLSAVATKGIHRTELPGIASGAVRLARECAWLRPQDGALPQRLSLLPLEASRAWWGPLASLVASAELREAEGWLHEGAPRWRSAMAALSDLTASPSGWCGDGDEIWSLGRALLSQANGDDSRAETENDVASSLAPESTTGRRMRLAASRGDEAVVDELNDHQAQRHLSGQIAALHLDGRQLSQTAQRMHAVTRRFNSSATDADHGGIAGGSRHASDEIEQLLADARWIRAVTVALPFALIGASVSWRLWGKGGAVVTTVLHTFCPTLLAHTPLLTADGPAALMLHTTLWSLWALLHAHSALSAAVATLASGLSLGLLLSCGPMAALLLPAVPCLLAARAVAALGAPLYTDLWSTRASRQRTPAGLGESPNRSLMPTLRPNTRVLLWRTARVCGGPLVCAWAVLWLAGICACMVHSLPPPIPMIRYDAAQTDAAAKAWATATSRFLSAKRNGASTVSESAPMISPPAHREVDVALLVLAERLATLGVVPRVLLILGMHHAAILSELSRGTAHHNWDAPADRRVTLGSRGSKSAGKSARKSASKGASNDIDAKSEASPSSMAYRSGVFALRSEARQWSGIPPFARFHLMCGLLKTPPTVLYLLALLATVHIRRPLGAAAHALGVLFALALFRRALRSHRLTEWARTRIARLMARSAWQSRVDAAFSQLLGRHRPHGRQGRQASASTSDEGRSGRGGRDGSGPGGIGGRGSGKPCPGDGSAAADTSSAGGSAVAVASGSEDHTEKVTSASSRPHRACRACETVYCTSPLWAVVVGYAVLLSMGVPPSAGHRLLLALYPTTYVILGSLVPLATAGGADAGDGSSDRPAASAGAPLPLLSAAVGLLLLLHVSEGVAAHPHYLTYFAPVAGGRTGGHYHLLADSLDQGQDLPHLEAWLRENVLTDEPVYLAYNGEDEVRARSIGAHLLPAASNAACTAHAPFAAAAGAPDKQRISPEGPRRQHECTPDVARATLRPGLYCIEANALHGLSTAVPGPWTDVAEASYQTLRHQKLHTQRAASPLRFARLCAMLRKLPPLARLGGGSLLVWRLSADELRGATSGRPHELFPARDLSPGMQKAQRRALERVMHAIAGSNGMERARQLDDVVVEEEEEIR